jgi:hypothetical protein
MGVMRFRCFHDARRLLRMGARTKCVRPRTSCRTRPPRDPLIDQKVTLVSLFRTTSILATLP